MVVRFCAPNNEPEPEDYGVEIFFNTVAVLPS